jgi:hypothetical protein
VNDEIYQVIPEIIFCQKFIHDLLKCHAQRPGECCPDVEVWIVSDDYVMQEHETVIIPDGLARKARPVAKQSNCN